MNTSTIQQLNLLINGKIVSAKEGKYFDSINPSIGETFAQVADATLKDMQAAIASSRKSFEQGPWRAMTPSERGIYLKKIAKAIREQAKELADLETLDIGKTLKQSTFIDVPTCADTFDYFSNISEPFESKTCSIELPSPVKSVVEREPMGVVGCIIPWNYPLIMAAWKIAPALMAGNSVILKPSPLGCVSIMKLAQIIQSCDLPAGVLNVIPSSSHDVSAALVKSLDVDMISFTGGNETGQEVMRLAADTTKKLTLELGGKSPNIVFADCDLDSAIGGTMSAIFMNQGQMCTAGSRLLLEDQIYDEFMGKLIEKTKNLKVGNADNYETSFGPLISQEHRDKNLAFIEQGKKDGAKLVCGGKIPEGDEYKNGFYFEPAIFEDVDNAMTIAQEEVFGPVLSVMKFSGTEEAIRIANDTPYGLASTLWTKDLDKANDVAKQLQCGTVWINTYGGFYNEAPFGGYKQSGFGRELGIEGLLEYTQIKHVCTDATPEGKPLVASWF